MPKFEGSAGAPHCPALGVNVVVHFPFSQASCVFEDFDMAAFPFVNRCRRFNGPRSHHIKGVYQ